MLVAKLVEDRRAGAVPVRVTPANTLKSSRSALPRTREYENASDWRQIGRCLAAEATAGGDASLPSTESMSRVALSPVVHATIPAAGNGTAPSV
jgi:hypothetical protein